MEALENRSGFFLPIFSKIQKNFCRKVANFLVKMIPENLLVLSEIQCNQRQDFLLSHKRIFINLVLYTFLKACSSESIYLSNSESRCICNVEIRIFLKFLGKTF